MALEEKITKMREDGKGDTFIFCITPAGGGADIQEFGVGVDRID